MKPSQIKLSKQFYPSHKSYGCKVRCPSGVWGGAPAADDSGVSHSKKKEAFGAIIITIFLLFSDFLKIENFSSSKIMLLNFKKIQIV